MIGEKQGLDNGDYMDSEGPVKGKEDDGGERGAS